MFLVILLILGKSLFSYDELIMKCFIVHFSPKDPKISHYGYFSINYAESAEKAKESVQSQIGKRFKITSIEEEK